VLPPIEYGYRSGPSGQARGPGGLTNSTFTSLHWVHGGHLNPGRSAFFGRGRQSPAIGLARQYPPMPPVQALLMKAPLKEVKLDNNMIQDRGAQLCSVVLGSIRLEVLDVSCNRISTIGVKAIMKSLSENDSLKRLALCGIPMDQNASKAVSYALAYNQSLQRLNIDSCSVGYSGQRHIVAGIVSNRYTKLHSLTGFPLARKSAVYLLIQRLCLVNISNS